MKNKKACRATAIMSPFPPETRSTYQISIAESRFGVHVSIRCQAPLLNHDDGFHRVPGACYVSSQGKSSSHRAFLFPTLFLFSFDGDRSPARSRLLFVLAVYGRDMFLCSGMKAGGPLVRPRSLVPGYAGEPAHQSRHLTSRGLLALQKCESSLMTVSIFPVCSVVRMESTGRESVVHPGRGRAGHPPRRE
jgi:hypothetical protein